MGETNKILLLMCGCKTSTSLSHRWSHTCCYGDRVLAQEWNGCTSHLVAFRINDLLEVSHKADWYVPTCIALGPWWITNVIMTSPILHIINTLILLSSSTQLPASFSAIDISYNFCQWSRGDVAGDKRCTHSWYVLCLSQGVVFFFCDTDYIHNLTRS